MWRQQDILLLYLVEHAKILSNMVFRTKRTMTSGPDMRAAISCPILGLGIPSRGLTSLFRRVNIDDLFRTYNKLHRMISLVRVMPTLVKVKVGHIWVHHVMVVVFWGKYLPHFDHCGELDNWSRDFSLCTTTSPTSTSTSLVRGDT